MSAKFDRFMVANDNGRNLKLARLTDGEFRAFIQGVLPIASEATPRGAFMVGSSAATPEDVAFVAQKVPLRTAKAAIEKMRSLGMLEFDDELGAEWVHDFDKLNPAPKTDPTNAKRQAEWRARNAESNASRNSPDNAGVTPPEVKKIEVEDPTIPPEGGMVVTLLPPIKPTGTRQRDIDGWQQQFAEWAGEHFPGADPAKVVHLVQQVRGRHTEPTPAAIREFAAKSAVWAQLLEPAA